MEQMTTPFQGEPLEVPTDLCVFMLKSMVGHDVTGALIKGDAVFFGKTEQDVDQFLKFFRTYASANEVEDFDDGRARFEADDPVPPCLVVAEEIVRGAAAWSYSGCMDMELGLD